MISTLWFNDTCIHLLCQKDAESFPNLFYAAWALSHFTNPLFIELQYKPLLVDLTVEEGTRLKVLYGSSSGFHAVDLDSARFVVCAELGEGRGRGGVIVRVEEKEKRFCMAPAPSPMALPSR